MSHSPNSSIPLTNPDTSPLYNPIYNSPLRNLDYGSDDGGSFGPYLKGAVLYESMSDCDCKCIFVIIAVVKGM